MSLSGTSELPWFTRPSGVDRSDVKISSPSVRPLLVLLMQI